MRTTYKLSICALVLTIGLPAVSTAQDLCLVDSFGYSWSLNVVAAMGSLRFLDGGVQAGDDFVAGAAIADLGKSPPIVTMTIEGCQQDCPLDAHTYLLELSEGQLSGVWTNVTFSGSFGEMTVDFVACGVKPAAD